MAGITDLGGDDFLAHPTEKPAQSFLWLAEELRRHLIRLLESGRFDDVPVEVMNLLLELRHKLHGGTLGMAAETLAAARGDRFNQEHFERAARAMLNALDEYLNDKK